MFRVHDLGPGNPSPLGEGWKLDCRDGLQAWQPHGENCICHLVWTAKVRYQLPEGKLVNAAVWRQHL